MSWGTGGNVVSASRGRKGGEDKDNSRSPKCWEGSFLGMSALVLGFAMWQALLSLPVAVVT